MVTLNGWQKNNGSHSPSQEQIVEKRKYFREFTFGRAKKLNREIPKFLRPVRNKSWESSFSNILTVEHISKNESSIILFRYLRSIEVMVNFKERS
jgi:hypothetical protein